MKKSSIFLMLSKITVFAAISIMIFATQSCKKEVDTSLPGSASETLTVASNAVAGKCDVSTSQRIASGQKLEVFTKFYDSSGNISRIHFRPAGESMRREWTVKSGMRGQYKVLVFKDEQNQDIARVTIAPTGKVVSEFWYISQYGNYWHPITLYTDGNGRATRIETNELNQVFFSYDASGNLSQVTSWEYAGSGFFLEKSWHYKYVTNLKFAPQGPIGQQPARLAGQQVHFYSNLYMRDFNVDEKYKDYMVLDILELMGEIPSFLPKSRVSTVQYYAGRRLMVDGGGDIWWLFNPGTMITETYKNEGYDTLGRLTKYTVAKSPAQFNTSSNFLNTWICKP